jgi:peptidoglycan/LPS O-acetylase OafA/YrhL
VIYHLGASWLPGGFLGVDVFFVLSGYLITWILLETYERSGTIDFAAFYRGRARRLLPAFGFVVLGIAIGVGLWAPDTIARFLEDLPWAAAGLTNWWFIFNEQNYFEAIGRPSLLQHTWSLAIEAQFYLIWPVIVLAVVRTWGVQRLRYVALAGAAFSWVSLLLASTHADSSTLSASHFYFGTDTHSSGLFLGAALAVSWRSGFLHADIGTSARRTLNVVGGLSLVVLLWAFAVVNQTTGLFYTEGFVIVGLASVGLLMSIVHPASDLRRVLSTPLLRWLGTRSYSLYLWHWIVIQTMRPGLDVQLSEPVAVVVQLSIIAALSEFSYRYVEMPIRTRRLQEWWQERRRTQSRRATIALAAVGLILPLSAAAIVDTQALDIARAETARATAVVNDADLAITPPVSKRTVHIFGDSVLLGAQRGFEQGFQVAGFDAEVGVQAHILIRKIRAYANAGPHPHEDVIFNIGVNGTLKPEHLVKIFDALAATERIVIINTAVPRPWEQINNHMIAQWAADHPRKVRLADWNACSADRPELFVRDGVHLTPAGVEVMVECVRDAYMTP